MMVRSQNKELITFLENIQVIKIRKDTDESVRIVFEYVEGSKTMGQYHSYQVALKVLDMIQEAYLHQLAYSSAPYPFSLKQKSYFNWINLSLIWLMLPPPNLLASER